jgi:hypothetical protein
MSMKLRLPFDGSFPITQTYQEHVQRKIDENLTNYNPGIDWGNPTGTPILATDTGKVTLTGNDQLGYGIFIRITHAWGRSIYAHLIVAYVKEGDVVTVGDLIGLSDSTGNSTGPHLHFETRDNNNACFDPTPYFVSGDVTPGPVPEPVPFDNDDTITADDLPCDVEVIGTAGSNLRPDTTIDDTFIVTIPHGKRVPVDKLVNGWLHVDAWIKIVDTDGTVIVRKV